MELQKKCFSEISDNAIRQFRSLFYWNLIDLTFNQKIFTFLFLEGCLFFLLENILSWFINLTEGCWYVCSIPFSRLCYLNILRWSNYCAVPETQRCKA